MEIDVTPEVIRGYVNNPDKGKFYSLWEQDLIKIVAVKDRYTTIDDLKGDSYNPAVNPDMSPTQLYDEELNFDYRVGQEGIYGIIGMVKEHGEWTSIDSIFGFVGKDFLRSGYDQDILNTLVKKVEGKNGKE
jgi:hypothetical protein